MHNSKGSFRQDKTIEQLQLLLQKLLSKKQVKHAILGIESGDKSFRWVRAAGVAHPDGTTISEKTPFMIASVTKLYIAAAILKLYEQDIVKLDEPISSYLPQSITAGLHKLNGKDYTDKIYIIHLLSHTSGLPDWLEDRPKRGKSLLENIETEADRFISIDEAVEYVKKKLTPHFPPQPPKSKRKKIRYSDTNFQLIIAILEAQMKKPLHNVFDELIYKPLGLQHTFHPGNLSVENIPEPAVFWVGDKPFFKPLLLESFRDLYSTVDDLLTFLRAIISGKLFLYAETTELMQSNWNRFGFPTDAAAIRLPGWPIEYSLGMMRLKMPRIFTPFKPVPAFVGHTGVTGSWLFYCKELDLYLCGTVDQVSEAALPFRFVPKLLRIFG
jgi:CubicO group peptidase (beta-lactamase class C family)